MRAFLTFCICLLLLTLLTLLACTNEPLHAVSVETESPDAVPASMDVQTTSTPTVCPSPSASSTPKTVNSPPASALATSTPSPLPTPFSIVWLSDTQHLTFIGKLKPSFSAMTQWIVNNREKRNLVYVLHTGDVVDDGYSKHQWIVANGAFNKLAGQVPFAAVPGNHDYGSGKRDSKLFTESESMQKASWTETFADGTCGSILMNAGGVDFVIVGAGYSSSYNLEKTAWMRGVFNAHPDAVGIFFTHSYISNNGWDSTEGPSFRNEIISQCPNVRIVLCGHMSGVYRGIEAYDDDDDGIEERIVNVMLYNYQNKIETDQAGYLRILTFNTLTRSIFVETYSPILDRYWFTRQSDWRRTRFILDDAF